MLGFSSISEVSIAELPGTFVPASGLSATIAQGNVGVEAEGAADATAVTATITLGDITICLLYTSPSPRDATLSRMPSSA